MERNTNNLPVYLRAAEQFGDTVSWLKTTGWKLVLVTGFLSLTLIGLAWLIKIQLGTGLYTLFSLISAILFGWSVYTVNQMIKADRRGDFVSPDLRKLVFGQLASSAFSVIAVATITMVDPNFSFLSHDISPIGITIGKDSKLAQIAKNGELPPEAIGLNKIEGIASVGLSGFEGVEEHPQMRAHKNSAATTATTAFSEDAVKKMQYTYFLRVFKEREGFNPKIYWDKTQWSIGYGSFANELKKKSPNITVSKDEAYNLALKELNVCRAKAKADFNWLSHEQELSLMDLYYNAGKHCITGLKGQHKAGTLLAVMNRYAKDPYSVSYDQLYLAFVEAKDCSNCDKGKSCGHKVRRKLNVLQFLSRRSAQDFAAWKQAYDKIINGGNNQLAQL